MACARAVTTTLAMLCTLRTSGGQHQLEPSPHRPQLQELQQLTRLLENELQHYDNGQNSPQQPWWAQHQNQYVPLHLQDQPDVVLVPGQQQLANLAKQLEQGHFQDGQFGQRIKQRPAPQVFQPPPPPQQFPPQFKPLPEPFRSQPWQPVKSSQQKPLLQTQIPQQPSLIQQPLIHQQPIIQQHALLQQQPIIQHQQPPIQQAIKPFQPPTTPFQQLGAPFQRPATSFQQSGTPFQRPDTPFQHPDKPFQQPDTPFQQPSKPFQQLDTPFQQPSKPFQQPNTPFQQPSTPFQQPNTPFQLPNTPFQQPDTSFQQTSKPFQQADTPFQQPSKPFQQADTPFQQPSKPFQQDDTPFQKPSKPFQQPNRPPEQIPLNLQQQPEILDLSQLKQLVQLQQDLDQQREKNIRQRQQEQQIQTLLQTELVQQQQSLQQERNPQQQKAQQPDQQRQQSAQQKQPARNQSSQQQRQEQQRQTQQQQRQTNQIPSTNKEKQPQKPSNTTEKPIKSVRDLFNTSSCVEPPFTCPHPRIQFYLYTRSTQDNPQILNVLDPQSLRSSNFDPSLPIKVLIHGFQGGRQFSPSTDLRKAYFTRGGYNVVVVEYGSLVRLPCLNQVQWSPSFLAMCISQLVTYIGQTSGIPAERFHLIGYSIGAHVAGLVANYVENGKLGRITGLDPTIIFYQGSNKSHDLDPTDARFVDVIHTGAGILGQRGPNGHVDYYVNGGTTQPGCQSDSLIKTLSCDHTKVSPYYVESIVTPSGFWALPCPNYFMYLIGLCVPEDKDYVLMGEDAPLNARGIYYVTTNANKPYAKGWPGKGSKPKLPGRPFIR